MKHDKLKEELLFISGNFKNYEFYVVYLQQTQVIDYPSKVPIGWLMSEMYRFFTGRVKRIGPAGFLPVFCRSSCNGEPAGLGRSGPGEKLEPAGPVRSGKIRPVPALN